MAVVIRNQHGEYTVKDSSKNTSQCTNLCKRCAASSPFRRFEMNKRDLGRQREDRILVAEEDILHEIENQP
jgi:hypothetical protein